MNNFDDNKKLLAPLMERLRDGKESRHIVHSHHLLRQLRESVRQDLEHLLNTRYRCVSTDSSFSHLKSSLVNFGLPDMSTVNLTTKESRQQFCNDIEQAILMFEPRIKQVTVSSQSSIDTEDPTVRFRIEAKLHANPAPETIIFDSMMDPINHTINVAEIV